MKPGFCYVAERSTSEESIGRIAKSLAARSVTVQHPQTGRLSHLVGDGEDVDVTIEELVGLATRGVHLAWQLWLNADTFVACDFRRLTPELVRHGYSMDGLDPAERALIVGWATDYFHLVAGLGCAHVLVIDRAGLTANTDWDAVARHEVAAPPVIPEALGLPTAWLQGFVLENGIASTQLKDVTLLRRRVSADR